MWHWWAVGDSHHKPLPDNFWVTCDNFCFRNSYPDPAKTLKNRPGLSAGVLTETWTSHLKNHETQDCLPQLHRAADATAKRWNGLRLVYATMAYGQRDVAGVQKPPRWRTRYPHAVQLFAPENYRAPRGKDRLPTIIFQGRAVKLWGFNCLTYSHTFLNKIVGLWWRCIPPGK